MAHTPGPWQLRTVDHSLGTIETADEKFVIANTCQLRGNDYQSNHAERRANARLIAAAPDLLEALQVLASHWPHYAAHMDMKRIDFDAIAMARAAIAKATREQQ